MTKTFGLIVQTAFFAFVLLKRADFSGCAAIDCHSGQEAGLDIKVHEDGVYKIYNTDRGGGNINKSRFCRWNVKLKHPAKSASILLEKRRTDYHEVAPGDTMLNLTVIFISNGTEVWRYPWNERNMSLIKISRNEFLRIEQRIDNATALNSALYLSLTAAVQSYADTGKVHRSSDTQRYVVRSVEFVCGSLPVENCSMLAALAAQFSSINAMRMFVLNASTELKRYLTKPILLGLRFCNDSVMHYQEHGSTGNNTWKQVAGFEHSAVCNATDIQPASLVSLQTNSSNPNGMGLVLACECAVTDVGGVLIDLLRTEVIASPTIDPSSCAKSESDSKRESLSPPIAFVLVPVVLGILLLVFVYKKRKRATDRQLGTYTNLTPIRRT